MIIFIVIGIITCCVVLRWKNRKVYRLSSQIKNDITCLPLIGHAYLLAGNNEERMKTYKRFGRVAIESGGLTSLWIGHLLFAMVADPKLLEVILKTSLDKGEIMVISHELFGHGSIFAPVPIWRVRRKVIAPIFSTKNLNQFVRVFSEQGSVMKDQLKPVAGKGTFPLWKYLTTYSMDSVCETALGIKVDAQRNPDQPFLHAFERYCQMSATRISLPKIIQYIYKYIPLYTKNIHCMWEFVDKIIINKQEEIKENLNKSTKNSDSEQKTFLELYIKASGGTSGFTNVELREESLVLLLAGTDTSAVGSAFTCLMLARHPEVQDKVFEEIQNIFGDSDNPVTAEDLPRLKYLEAVLKETLRLYPPVPVITRQTEKDVMLPNGIELPKNTPILINIWAVHRHPDYWGADSEEFRPERFLEQDLKHPAAFMPFSYGPRSCLGYKYAMMSMLTAVTMLVRHYRLSTDRDLMHAPLRVKIDIMLKDVDSFELQLEARN